MDAVTEHENAEGECGDDRDMGDFAEVEVATHLLIAIECNPDPDHEKHSTHCLVKKDTDGSD